MKYPVSTLLQDVDPNDQLEFIPSLLIMCDPMATINDYFSMFERCVEEPRFTSLAYKNLVQEDQSCTTQCPHPAVLDQP